MKNLILTFATFTTLFSGSAFAQQNCAGYEIKMNGLIKQKNYEAAYPILEKALAECTNEKINIYNFGETVLEYKAENSTSDVDKKKYGSELSTLIDKRLQNFPNEKKSFWKGEQISYELKYGVIDKEQAYKKYSELFGNSDSEKLSANTVLTYYTTALELMNEEKLTFEEVLEVYFQTKKVAENNIELRSEEFGELAEKLDSLKQIDETRTLTKREVQIMENAQSAKDLFVEVNSSMDAILDEYTTCESIAPVFINQFDANKDSLEWITSSYQALASKDCYDTEIMKVLEERYAYVWKKQNPQATEVAANKTKSSGGIASAYGEGARDFKKGRYSSAIANFKKAINEVSGSTRGDVAYYIALSYQKTGSLSNAISWAKKAANYKKGWGAPYQLIAGVYGSNANSCGSGSFDKQSAYWVAADYANKACAVDSRSCAWGRKAARSYEATAPSMEQAFQQGLKKGDRVSVSCFGGATTRVR